MWGARVQLLSSAYGSKAEMHFFLSLFNTCMDWILGRVVDQSHGGASVGNTKITGLVFADDAVMFAVTGSSGDGSRNTARGGETFMTRSFGPRLRFRLMLRFRLKTKVWRLAR